MERALSPVTIGRDQELARLHDLLLAADRGESQFVLLSGDAGLGKTRLARDLARLGAELGMLTLWGGCSEAELALPYLPFLEAIGNYLSATDLDALRARLGSSHRELAHLFPQLELDALPADPSDPAQSKLRLFEALLALLRVPAEERGALFVIEDLHWADASTRELLEYLVRRMRATRMMVLATCRSEELSRHHPLAVMIDRWRRAGVAATLELSSLPPEGVEEMIRAIFGVVTVSHDVREYLHQRSEGNPFALEEILKAALDRGEIDPAGGAWRDLTPVRMRLPRTVRDGVLTRLERLPEGVAEVLRAASVLGGSFDYATLAAVSGGDPEAVQAALRTAVEQQLVEDDLGGDGRYRFRHALTRDAVYEDLLAPQRESLHLQAAEALQKQPGVAAVDLCHHLLAARHWELAVPLALTAAADAMSAHAYHGAASLYERVLPILTDPSQRGEVLCQLGTAFLLSGDAARAERHLAEGVRALTDAGATRSAAHHRLALGRCHWERSHLDLARACYEQSRSDLESGGPTGDLALAYVRLAGMAAFELDGRLAVAMAEQAVRIAEEAGYDPARIWAYNFLGLGLIQLGVLEAGLAHLDRSYQDAAVRGLNVIAANALYNGILVRVQHFRPLEALERVRTLQSMQAGSMASLQALRAEGTVWLWGLGEPARALAAFEQALALAREGEASHFETWLETQLAVACLQLDRFSEARRRLPPPGVEREGQDRIIEDWAAMRIDLDAGRLEDAVQRALAVVERTGWPLRVRLFIGDLAAEILLAARRLPETRRLVHDCAAAGAEPLHPYLLRMRGRLALAEQELAAAREQLAAAVEHWRRAAVRHEEAWTRLVLADVHAAAGRREEAMAELQRVLASARERGARFEERQARERLDRLGGSAVDVEQVRTALECLHEPAGLARSPLAALAAEGDVSLKDRLVQLIERAASSPVPRDAEAGRVLRDYYVRLVGSQEVVAERMHLTRATFYRRLHRGWQLVAEGLDAPGT